jgi:hypothetical protein
MDPILACQRPEARGGHSVASPEGTRKVRRVAIADQARHVGHRHRRLLDQQRCRRAHAPLQQVLVKALLAELGVGALQLARRARKVARHRGQRQAAAVVARHHQSR